MTIEPFGIRQSPTRRPWLRLKKDFMTSCALPYDQGYLLAEDLAGPVR